MKLLTTLLAMMAAIALVSVAPPWRTTGTSMETPRANADGIGSCSTRIWSMTVTLMKARVVSPLKNVKN